MGSAFGERLRSLREAQNLTLQQVADAAGCTKAYIWELEKKPGQRPSAERIQAIAKVLGVTMEVMIEVKLSTETSKAGAAPAELPGLIDAIRSCANLRLTRLRYNVINPDATCHLLRFCLYFDFQLGDICLQLLDLRVGLSVAGK